MAERLCSTRVIDRLAPLAAATQTVHTTDAASLGRILRRFRTLPEPDFELRDWTPFPRIRTRIADA